jgi:hypothetical protein
MISKFNYSGEKDSYFEDVWLSDNNVTYNFFPTRLKILNDLSILIAGCDYPAQNHLYTKEPNAQILFSTLNQNGQFISDFADNGRFIKDIMFNNVGVDETITDVLEDCNGNLIFIGFCKDNCFIFKVLPNGIVDDTFGNNGFYFFNIQTPFANITYTGNNILQHNDTYLTGWYNRIFCTNSNGTLNTNFNNSGVFHCENFTFQDMKFQSKEHLILGGSSNGNFAIARVSIPYDVSVKPNYNANNLFNVYPNPVKDNLYFMNEMKFEIIDIKGKVLLKSENAVQSVNVSHLKAGIYLIKFEDFCVRKFVKE